MNGGLEVCIPAVLECECWNLLCKEPLAQMTARIVCWSCIVCCSWVEIDDFQVGLTEATLPLAGLISSYENTLKSWKWPTCLLHRTSCNLSYL